MQLLLDLPAAQPAAPLPSSSPALASYDRVAIAFSGGKDSLACVLHLLDAGVPPERIELHHHDIDGGGRHFMDWPVTPAYCQAVAEHLGLPLIFSSKIGGFEREMLRQDARTAPTQWQAPDGTVRVIGGERGKEATRRRFPQTSADLSVRWCSAYLKIDVLAAQIRNEPRFSHSRTLVVTGERAQESAARSRYAGFGPHRTDNRHGTSRRLVDHWRPVLHWSEQDVWDLIAAHRIRPHPAYQLGWGRLSCMTCIFGSANQWATIRAIFPDRFETIAAYEAEFGTTIRRSHSVRQVADRGTPYAAALVHPDLVALAGGESWSLPLTVDPWTRPAGAFGENAGPT